MEPDVFDSIREGCRRVAEQARHVRIRTDRVQAYAVALPLEALANPTLDPDRHYFGSPEDTVAFFITLDAINFGSGYFPHLKKRAGMSGYFTVASSLTDHFRNSGPLSAESLRRLSRDDCTRLFDQDPDNRVVQELMGLFATALNDMGAFLMERFAGSFCRMVEAADANAGNLVTMLGAMPFFQDGHDYGGLPVPLYKRAQITAADLHTAFQGQGWGRFLDMDRLTIFADNLVPHVLRLDGVLDYHPDLADTIDRGQLLVSGTQEEIEIRACALHAVELMADALHAQGHPVTAAQLDYLLWNRGQEPYYKQTKPRHRCRTVYY